MSQTKPTELPEWDTNGTLNNEEPSVAVKSDGIVFGSPSKSSYHNWFMKLVYEWLEFVNRFFSTPDADTLEITDGTTVRATVSATGVDVPDLSTTNFAATNFSGDTVTINNDLQPDTNRGADIGEASLNFNRIHGRVFVPDIGVDTSNKVESLYEISAHKVPVACGAIMWDESANTFTLDPFIRSYNIASVDTAFYNVTYESVSLGVETYSAQAAIRIRMTDHTVLRDYGVVAHPMMASRLASAPIMTAALGGSDTTSAPTLSLITAAVTTGFSADNPVGGGNAATDNHNDMVDGDILIRPILVQGNNFNHFGPSAEDTSSSPFPTVFDSGITVDNTEFTSLMQYEARIMFTIYAAGANE